MRRSRRAALNGWRRRRQRQATLDEFSDEHEDIGMLFATSRALALRYRGAYRSFRNSRAYAHITDSAAFVGLGKSFQIWDRTALPIIRQACASVPAGKGRGCRRAPAQPSGARLTEAARPTVHVPVLLGAVTVDALAPRDGASLRRRHLWRRRLQPGTAGGSALPHFRHRPRSRGGAARARAGRAPRRPPQDPRRRAMATWRDCLAPVNFDPVPGSPSISASPQLSSTRPSAGSPSRLEGPLDMRMERRRT